MTDHDAPPPGGAGHDPSVDGEPTHVPPAPYPGQVPHPLPVEPAVPVEPAAEPLLVEPRPVGATPEPSSAASPEDAVAGPVPAGWADAQSAVSRAERRRVAEEAAREQSHRAHLRLAAFGIAAIVVIALATVVWTFLQRQQPDPEPQPSATSTVPVVTQPTLLFQIRDAEDIAVSNLLLSVGGPLGRANMIGVQQNTIVDVPTGGTLPFGQVARLPDPNGSATALSDAIGVNVNGTLSMDTLAFSGLVDAVGGVTVDVDVDVVEKKADGSTSILVPAGKAQLLQGPAAAAYATYLADGEPEEARIARASQVLRLVVAALPEDLTKVETILTQLGASARATVPFGQLAAFFVRLHADVIADDVVYQNLPVKPIDTGGPAAYRVDQTAAAAMVRDLLPEALRTPGPNSKVRVLVQNGVGSPGLNAAARSLLVDAGFTYVNGGNAPTFGQATTAIVVPDATSASVALGTTIATALKVPPTAVQSATTGQSVADVIVVLGADFTPTS